MDVLEIIEEYLEVHGYDGLYEPGECACKSGDLAPCGNIGHSCQPGYLIDKKGEYDFYIGPKGGGVDCNEQD